MVRDSFSESTLSQLETLYTSPDEAPEKESPWAVSGVLRSFLILFVMLLPVVGLIPAVIWACGGSKRRSTVNIARSFLIATAIIAVVITAIYLVFSINILSTVSSFVLSIPGIETWGIYKWILPVLDGTFIW